jgi:hypothetical protein
LKSQEFRCKLCNSPFIEKVTEIQQSAEQLWTEP